MEWNLQNGTLDRLYEDNFNIYKAFTTAEEKLYLSYASSDSEGKSLRPSILISKIKKIFPKIKEGSDMFEKKVTISNGNIAFNELLIKIRELKDGIEIDNEWYNVLKFFYTKDEWKYKLEGSLKGIYYTNSPTDISKETIDKLYGNILKTSISRLEQYRACPFSYYLKYGLKISEKDTFKVTSIDTGSFMHDVIDEFFNQIKIRNIKIKDIDDEEINKIIELIVREKLYLDKNYIFTSTPKYKILSKRLERVVLKSMKYIIESLKYSDFNVIGNEVEFKNGKEYPPITIELEDGKKIEVTGKIDRIDSAKIGNDEYIRIVDYKSSVKHLDLNEVYAGLQIQLLTYLDAICEKENVMPAGVLYFNLIDPIIKTSKNLSEEEIEEEIRKKFKMQGLILADVTVAKMMDRTLESGASKIVPAYLDKEGNLSKTRSNIVSKEQFEYLQKYMNKIIKQISQEILKGKIDLKPYYNVKNKKTPCEFCEYKSICNFNKSGCINNYNYIGNIDKEVILEMIKNEN